MTKRRVINVQKWDSPFACLQELGSLSSMVFGDPRDRCPLYNPGELGQILLMTEDKLSLPPLSQLRNKAQATFGDLAQPSLIMGTGEPSANQPQSFLYSQAVAFEMINDG